MNGFAILAIYAVVMITATLIFTKKEKNVEKLDNVCFEYSSYMDLGTGTVCIYGKSVYEWVCRPFLVFDPECIMSDLFHTICEKDTEGNARRNYAVWIHER